MKTARKPMAKDRVMGSAWHAGQSVLALSLVQGGASSDPRYGARCRSRAVDCKLCIQCTACTVYCVLYTVH